MVVVEHVHHRRAGGGAEAQDAALAQRPRLGPVEGVAGLGQVWATDLWFSATENLPADPRRRVADAVFPIHADARALPFAAEFFDAIARIDSFFYYGTDDLYLNYLARFLKPDGPIGIAGAGLVQELTAVPEHLAGLVGAEPSLPPLGWLVAAALGAHRHRGSSPPTP